MQITSEMMSCLIYFLFIECIQENDVDVCGCDTPLLLNSHTRKTHTVILDLIVMKVVHHGNMYPINVPKLHPVICGQLISTEAEKGISCLVLSHPILMSCVLSLAFYIV